MYDPHVFTRDDGSQVLVSVYTHDDGTPLTMTVAERENPGASWGPPMGEQELAVTR